MIENQPDEISLANKPIPVEAISPKDFIIKFLKDTKQWDGFTIKRDYQVLARNSKDVMKLVNNIRVGISRIRTMYRINNKPVPQFRFTSEVKLISEPNENGYSLYNLTLGKENATSTINKQLIEELL